MTDKANSAARLRTAAAEILARVKRDPTFKKELQADPDATLLKLDVGEQYLEDFKRELVIDGRRLQDECTLTCDLTCAVTTVNNPDSVVGR